MSKMLHSSPVKVNLTPTWFRKIVNDGSVPSRSSVEAGNLLRKALLFSPHVAGVEFSWADGRIFAHVLLEWGSTLEQLEGKRMAFVEALLPIPGTVLRCEAIPETE